MSDRQTPDAGSSQDEDLTVRGARDEVEEEAVERAKSLSPRLVFDVVMREGEEELRRPLPSLVFSALAAGIVISFSVLGMAILRAHLPETPWRPLVESWGYSMGFLLVILGRMQLFTENTITTVLPSIGQPGWRRMWRVTRLWSVVLAANVAGAFIAAAFIVWTPVFAAPTHEAIHELSLHATAGPAGKALVKGVPAGILVAALVWMIAAGERAGSFWLILLFTWFIAAGGFTHIVAGSVEMAYLILKGVLSVEGALLGFFLPVLAGNVIGGTAVFSLLAWGQVSHEMERR